jgi:hypothetical protein
MTNYGYARVSTGGQTLDAQIAALRRALSLAGVLEAWLSFAASMMTVLVPVSAPMPAGTARIRSKIFAVHREELHAEQD